MSQSQGKGERTFATDADLTEKSNRFVRLADQENSVELATATGDQVVGVTQQTTLLDEPGQAVTVRFLGTSRVVASGAISKGDVVTADEDGKAQTNSGGTAVGIALESASADNDVIEVMLTIGA